MLKKRNEFFLCIKHADNAFNDPIPVDSDRKHNRSRLNMHIYYSIEVFDDSLIDKTLTAKRDHAWRQVSPIRHYCVVFPFVVDRLDWSPHHIEPMKYHRSTMQILNHKLAGRMENILYSLCMLCVISSRQERQLRPYNKSLHMDLKTIDIDLQLKANLHLIIPWTTACAGAWPVKSNAAL